MIELKAKNNVSAVSRGDRLYQTSVVDLKT